jgi:hypothetical protein
VVSTPFYARIASLNRLRNGARLCAELQPQHVLMSKRFESFQHAMGCVSAAPGPSGHSRAPEPGFAHAGDYFRPWISVKR